MPRYRLTKRTVEITSIIVEAESEEAADEKELDDGYDEQWQNADWDEAGGDVEVEEVGEDEPLTEPYKAPSKEDLEKVMTYANQAKDKA